MTVGLANQGLTYATGLSFYVTAVASLVTGAVFMMWLGEQITERGVGNGISLLIFAGIVAGLPAAIGQSLEQARQGEISILILLGILVLAAVVIYLVVFILGLSYPILLEKKHIYFLELLLRPCQIKDQDGM